MEKYASTPAGWARWASASHSASHSPARMQSTVSRPVTVAGVSAERVRRARDLFSTSNFRVYSSPDIISVELGGALKNVIAIAVGIADGLGFGRNTRAALITRAIFTPHKF